MPPQITQVLENELIFISLPIKAGLMTHDEVIGEPISTSRSMFAIPPLNFSSHRVPAVTTGGYLLHCPSRAKVLGGQWVKWGSSALNVGKE